MGHLLRGDDGVGPLLIERVRDRLKALCLDVGTAPERYSGTLIREQPDTILLVDAVCLDLAPGEISLLRKQELINTGFSTHTLSPHLFIDYLEEHIKAQVYLLGIQPQQLDFGEELSEPVKQAMESVAQTLEELLGA